MQAIDLINLCAREYQDVAFERIAKNPAGAVLTNGANWLDYLNDAQRTVVLERPDSNATIQAALLVAGTRQTLPTGALRLLGVSRNMGVDGLTAGPVIAMSDRTSIDAVDLNWHTKDTAIVVTDVIYDDKKTPLSYFVSPPIPATPAVYIELELAKAPTDVADADIGAVNLSDVYSAPVQFWMLYRAYALATQATNQFQRAQFYFTNFFNLLGIKVRNEAFLSANTGGAYVPSPTNLGAPGG